MIRPHHQSPPQNFRPSVPLSFVHQKRLSEMEGLALQV